jgi:hypothetical protein
VTCDSQENGKKCGRSGCFTEAPVVRVEKNEDALESDARSKLDQALSWTQRAVVRVR